MARCKAKSDFDLLKELSKGISGMTTMDGIEEEIVVPTMFTSYNRATGVGGHPLRRITMIHGPNGAGKSVLAMGIAESLRQHGHIPVIYDTEFAAEKRWYGDLGQAEGILFKMPDSMDEMMDITQELLDRLAKFKSEKKVSKDIGYVFVVDTFTKLLPLEVLKKLREKGVEKMYPVQAQWISIWSKSITPLLYRSNSCLIAILQDRENMDAGAFGSKRKVTGGQALQYDSSLRIDVKYAKSVKSGGEEGKVIGTQSFYTLEKNKVDGVRKEAGSFFVGNGHGSIPKGFDLVSEAVEEAKLRGCVKRLTEKKEKKDKKSKEDDEKGGVRFFLHDVEVRSDGGWADFTEMLREDPEKFKAMVGALNQEAENVAQDG